MSDASRKVLTSKLVYSLLSCSIIQIAAHWLCFTRRPLKKCAQGSLFGWGFSSKKKEKEKPPSSNLDSVTTNSLSTSPSVGSNSASLPVSTLSPNIGTNAPASTSSSATLTPLASVRRSCEGVIPLNDTIIKRQLDMIYRYCPRSRPGSNYVLNLLGGVQANVYATACNGVGIVRHDKRSGGVHCDSCDELWKKEGSRIKRKVIKKKAEKLIEVVSALHATMMNDDHFRTFDNFSRNKDADLNSQGIELKEKVNSYKEFYKEIKLVSASIAMSVHLKLASYEHFPAEKPVLLPGDKR